VPITRERERANRARMLGGKKENNTGGGGNYDKVLFREEELRCWGGARKGDVTGEKLLFVERGPRKKSLYVERSKE